MSTATKTLDAAQQRQFRQWRQIVIACVGSATIALAVGIGSLFWPGASTKVRLLSFELAMEGMLAAGLMTVLGRCPACRRRFGVTSNRLAPECCPGCGVTLA